MQEELITFETAKLAKEKGFNYPCRGKIECSHYHFIKDNIIPNNIPTSSNELFAPIKNWNIDIEVIRGRLDRYTSLPTQSLLQKWLREVHNIHVDISPLHLTEGWRQQAYNMEKGHYNGAGAGFHYKTYEKALEDGLQKALKLIEIVKEKL